jgi:hypothetical protein
MGDFTTSINSKISFRKVNVFSFIPINANIEMNSKYYYGKKKFLYYTHSMEVGNLFTLNSLETFISVII